MLCLFTLLACTAKHTLEQHFVTDNTLERLDEVEIDRLEVDDLLFRARCPTPRLRGCIVTADVVDEVTESRLLRLELLEATCGPVQPRDVLLVDAHMPHVPLHNLSNLQGLEHRGLPELLEERIAVPQKVLNISKDDLQVSLLYDGCCSHEILLQWADVVLDQRPQVGVVPLLRIYELKHDGPLLLVSLNLVEQLGLLLLQNLGPCQHGVGLGLDQPVLPAVPLSRIVLQDLEKAFGGLPVLADGRFHITLFVRLLGALNQSKR
mmetsp:Transcript_39701/g.97579  ORF Transcript_39701/g.97579 Transcript_39701/m.97579 type:complete len:264 (+) Transcript_39701:1878-2669(+)